ncbi:MAG TPA: hypothetical protein VGM90_11950 [Kofleriaceae bacterium]|jgi:hypothetical protein
MARYVSYLLDLAGEGEVRTIKGSIRFVPDPDKSLIPTSAFLWKVVVSDQGDVWVRGMSRGTYALIATARWDTESNAAGALVDQKQIDDKNPTGFQWNLIHDSVSGALAQAERAYTEGSTQGPSASDKIEEPSEKELATLQATDDANAAMQMNLRANEKVAAQVKTSAKTRKQGLIIGFTVSAVVIVAITVPIVCAVHKRGQDKVAVPTLPNGDPVLVTEPLVVDANAVPSMPVDAPIDASPEEAVMTAESLPSAIALSKSAFTVSTTNEVSEGALRLAHFNHMQWSDVDVPAETTLPLIEKDAEGELGKRLCVDGQIITIRRRDLEQPPRAPKKLFVGRISAGNEDIAFVAVGSTGSLVKLDKARFCGVSTGLANIAPGLAGNVPELVGMFDLPETRQPQAEQ